MKVYIIGPSENTIAYERAEKRLNNMGYVAIRSDENSDEKECQALMNECELVCLLPSWELSFKAQQEVHYANLTGITLKKLSDFGDYKDVSERLRLLEQEKSEKEERTKRTIGILQTAIKTYGTQSQIQMAIEEMSELIKALCKFTRSTENTDQIKVVQNDVKEEIADVSIMLKQLVIMFGDCSQHEDQKIERLYKMLEL